MDDLLLKLLTADRMAMIGIPLGAGHVKNAQSSTCTSQCYHSMVLQHGENFTFVNNIFWQKNGLNTPSQWLSK
jgi:hypothetical protein